MKYMLTSNPECLTMLLYRCWILIGLIWAVDGQCDASKPLVVTATAGPQYITSPSYPSNYDNNLDCQWHIVGSASTPVIINIEDLDTEVTNETCTNDILSVYHGASTLGTLLTTSCSGNDNVSVAVSTDATTGSFYVSFITDATNVARGFQILYFIADAAYQPSCGSPLTANATEIYLMTDTLPGIYTSTLDCSYGITAQTGYTINITYILVHIQNDASCSSNKIAIYDGTDNSATELDSRCTEGDVYTFNSILTSGNEAYVEFSTGGTNTQFLGFVFTYREYLTTTTCSKTPVNLDATEHHSYITTVNFGTSSYARNLDCYWLLTAPTNDSVEVLFLELNGESFSLEYNFYCSYDFVRLYDGNSTSASVINKFCGSTMATHTYRSSDIHMLVYFTSDYALQRNGFRLAYKAVDNTYPGCKAAYTNILDPLYNIEASYISSGHTFRNSISSTNYASTYPNYDETFWLLSNTRSANYSAIIDVKDISIERARGCIYDRLVIYNGPCIKDGPLITLCGYREGTYELTGSEYLIQFHSDGSARRRGFTLEYYADYKNVTVAPTTTTTTNGPPVEAVVNAMNVALENYTNENLPNRDLTDAIQAQFDFFLVGINGLDEVDQTFTTTGQFEVTWNDTSLSWIPAKQQEVVRMLFPQDDVWKPDIVLLNGASKITPMGASFMFVDVNFDGVCFWKPFQILKTTCKIDMTFYPYDKQSCVLKFSTWSSSGSEVTTSLGNLGFQLHTTFSQNPVWELLSTETVQEQDNGQNVVKFILHIQRQPAYVTFYITIPMVMLAYLNVFTFAIPCESGEKSGFSITVFLSFIVVLIVITDSMPDNSDSISLYGAYVFTMTLLSALAVMMSVVQLRALSFSEEDRPIGKRVKKYVLAIQRLKWKIFTKRTVVKKVEQSSDEKKSKENDEDDDSIDDMEDNKFSSSSSGFEDMEHETSPKRVSFREDHLYSEDSEFYGNGYNRGSYESGMQRELTVASIMLDKQDTFLSESNDPRATPNLLGRPQNELVSTDGSQVDNDHNKTYSSNDEYGFENDDENERNDKKVKFEKYGMHANNQTRQLEKNDQVLNKSPTASSMTPLPPPYESVIHDQASTSQPGRPVSRSGIMKGILAERPRSVMGSLQRRKASATDHSPFSKFSQPRSGAASSSGVFTPQKSEPLSDDDSVIGSYYESESDDLSDLMSNDDADDDSPSWPELVHASDIVLFCVYMLITTFLTLGFFTPMALN